MHLRRERHLSPAKAHPSPVKLANPRAAKAHPSRVKVEHQSRVKVEHQSRVKAAHQNQAKVAHRNRAKAAHRSQVKAAHRNQPNPNLEHLPKLSPKARKPRRNCPLLPNRWRWPDCSTCSIHNSTKPNRKALRSRKTVRLHQPAHRRPPLLLSVPRRLLAHHRRPVRLHQPVHRLPAKLLLVRPHLPVKLLLAHPRLPAKPLPVRPHLPAKPRLVLRHLLDRQRLPALLALPALRARQPPWPKPPLPRCAPILHRRRRKACRRR